MDTRAAAATTEESAHPDVHGRGELVAPALTAGAAVASLGLVAAVDPNVPGRYPVCPSIVLFGVFCPFCGGLRGAHALTEGDLAGMVASNLLVPVVIVLAAWGWLAWTTRVVGVARPVPGPRASTRTWLVVAGLALLYGVLRNVPGFEALAP